MWVTFRAGGGFGAIVGDFRGCLRSVLTPTS